MTNWANEDDTILNHWSVPGLLWIQMRDCLPSRPRTQNGAPGRKMLQTLRLVKLVSHWRFLRRPTVQLWHLTHQAFPFLVCYASTSQSPREKQLRHKDCASHDDRSFTQNENNCNVINGAAGEYLAEWWLSIDVYDCLPRDLRACEYCCFPKLMKILDLLLRDPAFQNLP